MFCSTGHFCYLRPWVMAVIRLNRPHGLKKRGTPLEWESGVALTMVEGRVEAGEDNLAGFGGNFHSRPIRYRQTGCWQSGRVSTCYRGCRHGKLIPLTRHPKKRVLTRSFLGLSKLPVILSCANLGPTSTSQSLPKTKIWAAPVERKSGHFPCGQIVQSGASAIGGRTGSLNLTVGGLSTSHVIRHTTLPFLPSHLHFPQTSKKK